MRPLKTGQFSAISSSLLALRCDLKPATAAAAAADDDADDADGDDVTRMLHDVTSTDQYVSSTTQK